MSSSLRLQLLTCLVVYVSSVHSIKVKFGTSDGPIAPLSPEPLPPLQPHPVSAPAPVWEEREDDSPDPNAQWRPQLFVPQPKYTQVIFNLPTTTEQPLNSAQKFVNSYKSKYQSINRQPIQQYFHPAQVLGSQSLPGIGIRYFVPAYIKSLQERKEKKRQEDARHNDIESNDISEPTAESSNDLLWQFEKESTKRALRNRLEGSARPTYKWPEYVQPRH